MVQIWCKLCSVHVEVKNWNPHITDKQHNKNLPSKIIVKGTFNSTQVNDLHKYFANFGTIGDIFVYNGFGGTVFIQYYFHNPSVYTRIVHKQHLVFGNFLNVTWSYSGDTNTLEKDYRLSESRVVPNTSTCELDETPPEFFDNFVKPGFLDDMDFESPYELPKEETKKIVFSASSQLNSKRSFSSELGVVSIGDIEETRPKARKLDNKVDPNEFSIMTFSEIHKLPSTAKHVPPANTQTSLVLKKEHNDWLDQQFREKKISLWDYLTIKYRDKALPANPERQKNKEKILATCQRALNAMSFKTPNPIRIRSSPVPKPKVSHKSPLTISKTEFRYSSPKTLSFSQVFHTILSKTGILSTETDVVKLLDSVIEYSLAPEAVIDRKVAAKMLQISLLGWKYNRMKDHGTKKVDVETQCGGGK